MNFLKSTLGKKFLMAAKGVVLFSYVLAHTLASLQTFLGREAINGYGTLLRKAPPLLLGARAVVLFSVAVHTVVASLSQPVVAGLYIVAVLPLGFHLYHGMWSLFQTLGASHRSYDRLRRIFAPAFAARSRSASSPSRWRCRPGSSRDLEERMNRNYLKANVLAAVGPARG